jgi:hypothetical protein
VTPELVARKLLRRLDSPPAEMQVGIGNDVMRFGFSFLPRAYDALVGPLFGVIGLDTTKQRPADAGNVLEPNPDGNAVRGNYPSVVTRVGRVLRDRVATRTTPGRHA